MKGTYTQLPRFVGAAGNSTIGTQLDVELLNFVVLIQEIFSTSLAHHDKPPSVLKKKIQKKNR